MLHAIHHTPPPRLSFAEQYEEMVIAIPNDNCIYYVTNGTRHCFISLQQFLNYGYDYNMVIKFTVKKNIRLIKDEIPIGDTVL